MSDHPLSSDTAVLTLVPFAHEERVSIGGAVLDGDLQALAAYRDQGARRLLSTFI
jgi:hypothetical protein